MSVYTGGYILVLETMFLCQYYTRAAHDRGAVITLAECLDCRYRVAVCGEGWIIALIADEDSVGIIRKGVPLPQVISQIPD